MLQADIQKTTLQVKTLAETDGQGDSVMKETSHSYKQIGFFNPH